MLHLFNDFKNKIINFVFVTDLIYTLKPASTKVTATTETKTVATAEKPQSKGSSGEFKFYTVQKGDSLYRIALLNKTTVEELKRLNNFGDKFSLMPGQKIKVGML